jgi:hypothetical protein
MTIDTDEIDPRTITYLGDGVYVSVTDWGAKLITERENGNHYIVLDNQMIARLYAMTTKAMLGRDQKRPTYLPT